MRMKKKILLNKREYNSERRRKLDIIIIYPASNIYKREYNSERRRKLLTNVLQSSQLSSIIRENITPRGDGSNLKDILIKILLL